MAILSGQLLNEDLEMLKREKGRPCISIIVPLHFPEEGKADKLHIGKVIKAAGEQVLSSYPDKAGALIDSMKNLFSEINFDRNQEGIGLFVSPGFGYQTFFPFTVTEKIVVGQNFDLRDLLYKSQYSLPYYVLHLDEKKARLYKGKLKHLEEINNKDFPLAYHNEQEYQPPAQSSSYAGYAHVKSFERDKAALEKRRFESFLHHADELIDDYIKDSEAIILCGVKRYTSAFLNRTNHGEKIITVINGNYEWVNTTEVAAMAWPAIQAFIAEKMIDEISDFKEKTGEGLAEEGVLPVWDAIAEGRGLKLLLEKDYHVQGFLEKQYSYQLYLQPPKEPHIILKDAISELIERMLDKDGKIIFVENGMLRKHQSIALITRY